MRALYSTLMSLIAVFALGLVGCDEATDADAGPDRADAGTADAGSVDGGQDDGGPVDGGPMDGGRADGGRLDGGADADGGPTTGACPAAPVQILASCPAFAPCGGALEGAFCYAGICIEEAELLGRARDFCPTVELREHMGTVTGRVVFFDDGGPNVSRVATTHVEGTVYVPPSCAFGMCGTVEATIDMGLGPGGTATCAADGSAGCVCEIVLDSAIDSSEPYVASGNTITVDPAGSARTFDYCVEGDGTLRFRETGGEAQELGVQTLTPE